MRIPKHIERRAKALQTNKTGFYPDMVYIERVKTNEAVPRYCENDADHTGEFRIIVCFWNGKAGTGDDKPNRIIYAPTYSAACEAVDEYLNRFPDNPFKPIVYYDDYSEAL